MGISHVRHEPFGRTEATGALSPNLLHVTGRERDGADLSDCRARYGRAAEALPGKLSCAHGGSSPSSPSWPLTAQRHLARLIIDVLEGWPMSRDGPPPAGGRGAGPGPPRMTLAIAFQEAAELESAEAAAFYERKCPGLDAAFLDELEIALTAIAQFPDGSPLLGGGQSLRVHHPGKCPVSDRGAAPPPGRRRSRFIFWWVSRSQEHP